MNTREFDMFGYRIQTNFQVSPTMTGQSGLSRGILYDLSVRALMATNIKHVMLA